MFPDYVADEAQSFHQNLARFNAIRTAPATPSPDWQADTDNEHAHRHAEGKFLEALRREVACAPFIAEGALMRLVCGARGARCYARYQLEFQTKQFALGQLHSPLQRAA